LESSIQREPEESQGMHPSIAHAVQIQGVNTNLFTRALEGVTAEESLRRPSEHTNPLLWIAAHLVTTRCYLGKVVGLECEIPWGARFARSAELDLSAALPSLGEVVSRWNEISAALAARFEQLGEPELAAPAGTFPSQDQTVRGALAMAALHDSYHVGQLAYLRKGLGRGQLVG
jgi:hypothetical protein